MSSSQETVANPLSAPIEKTDTRFLFVDGLRGVAALMVVIFHFTDAKHPFIKTLPSFFVKLLDDGRLGVDIFFVISGFVIAYSQRGTLVTGRYFLNFVVRRSLRLDPPYWFTIFLEIVLLFVLARVWHQQVHALPTVGGLLSHLVYAQHLFRYEDIVPVFWTLCLEVQFYILFTLMRGVSQFARREPIQHRVEATLMTLLALVSLGISASWIPNPPTGFFLNFWFMFFTGVTIWWAIATPSRGIWFAGTIALECVAMVVKLDTAILLVVLTATAIFTAAKWNRMQVWFSNRAIQFLGKISYSLYLIHVPVGLRAILYVSYFTGDSNGARISLVVLGLLISIGSATLMYLLIEQPSKRLSKWWLKHSREKKTEPVHLTTVQ